MSIVTIELRSKQYEALLQIASQEKKSEHQICLEAIEEYLGRREELTKGRAALLRLGKGPRDLADKHDEYLYGKESDDAHFSQFGFIRLLREQTNGV